MLDIVPKAGQGEMCRSSGALAGVQTAKAVGIQLVLGAEPLREPHSLSQLEPLAVAYHAISEVDLRG